MTIPIYFKLIDMWYIACELNKSNSQDQFIDVVYDIVDVNIHWTEKLYFYEKRDFLLLFRDKRYRSFVYIIFRK